MTMKLNKKTKLIMIELLKIKMMMKNENGDENLM